MSNKRAFPPQIDRDDAQVNAVAYGPAEARLAFIRKVYSIFSIAVAGWIGLSYIIMTQMPLLKLAASTPVFYGALIMWMFIGFGYAVVRKYGEIAGAAILLMEVTAAAVLTAPMVFAYAKAAGPAIILHAFVLTCAVFGALTLYVFVSKTDFSPWGPALMIGSVAAIAIVLLNLFLPIPGVMKYFSYLMVLLISGWTLYHTSGILNRYQEEEAIFAASAIFADFVILFWNILRILGGRD